MSLFIPLTTQTNFADEIFHEKLKATTIFLDLLNLKWVEIYENILWTHSKKRKMKEKYFYKKMENK